MYYYDKTLDNEEEVGKKEKKEEDENEIVVEVDSRDNSSTLNPDFESSGSIITDNVYEVNSENEEKKD